MDLSFTTRVRVFQFIVQTRKVCFIIMQVLKRNSIKKFLKVVISGPFSFPPFPTLRCSSLALIPKSVPGEFRLVLNLSYPPNNSVNDFIDNQFCTVRYSSVDEVVRMVQILEPDAFLAKADVKSAFRLLQIWPGDLDQLGFTFDGKFILGFQLGIWNLF